jgi:hypothetical protein
MNNGLRETWVIDDDAIPNLIAAANYAYWSMYPLNRFLSVNCTKGGLDHSDVHKFITKFNKDISDWLRYKSAPWHAIWILENPPPGDLNFHLLFHVPERDYKKFRRKHRDWLKRSGLKLLPNVSHLQTLESSEPDDLSMNYIRGLNRTLKYMFKGCSPEICEALEVERKDQGFIRGKRCGFSQALGPKARADTLRQKRLTSPRFINPPIILRDVWPSTPPAPWQKGRRRTNLSKRARPSL